MQWGHPISSCGSTWQTSKQLDPCVESCWIAMDANIGIGIKHCVSKTDFIAEVDLHLQHQHACTFSHLLHAWIHGIGLSGDALARSTYLVLLLVSRA